MSANEMDPDLPHRVLAACLAVHECLGPGLLRDVYEECLALELRELELVFVRGDSLTFDYRGKQVTGAARLDLVVEGALLVQVLAQDEVRTVDLARVEGLLRLSGLRSGLLVNFNVVALRKGVHRVTLKRRTEAGKGGAA
jgi:GxxExxY protein